MNLIIFLFSIPIISTLNILICNRKNSNINKIGLFWSIWTLIIFLVITLNFNEFFSFQYSLLNFWLPINYNISWGNIIFNIDGISLVFIGLSIILIPICILISWNSIKFFKKEFIIFLNLILLFLFGVFTIMDILGFYILFEAILIPMFLIIGIWGSREEKVKAAYYFFFYTLIGSLMMLLSIFKIYYTFGTTNYQTITILEIPYNLQYWIFIGIFMSLAVKIPMFPVHIWLPQAHVEAPIAGSVLLAGILLKLGGYGFIRFSYPILPLASEFFSPLIIMLSVIAIVYGALTTCRQVDIKRLIAYSSVSHMGLVTLSIFTHKLEGLFSSNLMMLAHGLVSSGLFMISAVLYVRFHTRSIKYFKGLTILMPITSTLAILLTLGNISFPLTLNFIAEFMSIIAIFNQSYVAGILTGVGMFLGTIYSLYMYNRIFFGSVTKHFFNIREITIYEFNSFMPLIILTIIFGIFPNYIIYILTTSSFLNISL